MRSGSSDRCEAHTVGLDTRPDNPDIGPGGGWYGAVGCGPGRRRGIGQYAFKTRPISIVAAGATWHPVIARGTTNAGSGQIRSRFERDRCRSGNVRIVWSSGGIGRRPIAVSATSRPETRPAPGSKPRLLRWRQTVRLSCPGRKAGAVTAAIARVGRALPASRRATTRGRAQWAAARRGWSVERQVDARSLGAAGAVVAGDSKP